MLKSQEIQLAQSKRREKMANIQKAEEINDDGRTELRSLTDAYEGAEVELRAALLVEGAERDKIKEPDRAETEIRENHDRCRTRKGISRPEKRRTIMTLEVKTILIRKYARELKGHL